MQISVATILVVFARVPKLPRADETGENNRRCKKNEFGFHASPPKAKEMILIIKESSGQLRKTRVE
jgi:hypothetical protein